MRDRVVEIAGVLAVDRDRHDRTEVGAAGDVRWPDLGPQAPRLFDGLVAVLVGNAVLADDDLDVDAGLVDVAEHFDDAAERAARGGRPSSDLDRRPCRPTPPRPARSCGIWTSMISRRSNGTTKPGPDSVAFEASDDRRRAAFEDAEDAAFGAAVGDAFDAGDDAVAVHRLIQVAAGDIDVALDVLDRPIRDDEAEPARIGGDPADDQVHAVRQAVAVAACLDQVAGGDQVLQEPLERRSFIAGNPQALQHLARRGGVFNFLANQPASSCSWFNIGISLSS